MAASLSRRTTFVFYPYGSFHILIVTSYAILVVYLDATSKHALRYIARR